MNDRRDKILDEKSALRTIDNIVDLPTIPCILLQVNKMLKEDDVSVRKLRDTIESDQVLTSRILKLVNSAFYGFRSRIIEIPQALMILGFNTVRNAVAAVSLIDLFRMKEKYKGFNIKDLWKHSVAVAVTSKNMARDARLTTPDDCFVAGLLHDIGKLVMAEYLQDVFSDVLKSTQTEGISFLEAENKISSINHAMIGGRLAGKWQFPDSLAKAIMYHHMVQRNAADFWLHICIYAANIIVNHGSNIEIAESEVLCGYPEFSEVLNRLGTLADWYRAVDAEIEQVTHFFIEDNNL